MVVDLLEKIDEIYTMCYRDYLESNADIMLGKPVVKGTRITVALILKKLSEGASTEDILLAYPSLTAISISAVLAYALDKELTEGEKSGFVANFDSKAHLKKLNIRN